MKDHYKSLSWSWWGLQIHTNLWTDSILTDVWEVYINRFSEINICFQIKGTLLVINGYFSDYIIWWNTLGKFYWHDHPLVSFDEVLRTSMRDVWMMIESLFRDIAVIIWTLWGQIARYNSCCFTIFQSKHFYITCTVNKLSLAIFLVYNLYHA